MVGIDAARDKIFDRVHRTGEEVKNDLPNWVERVVKDRAWSQVIDPSTGEPFANVGDWLVASWPLGPGMGSSEFSITYDEFILLCEKRPTLKDLLVRHRPKGKRGGDTRSDAAKAKQIHSRAKQGNSRQYIEERLQRDYPEVWREYLDGKFRSARQAAIAAGFIKVNADHSAGFRRSVAAMTAAELRNAISKLDAKAAAKLRKALGK